MVFRSVLDRVLLKIRWGSVRVRNGFSLGLPGV